MVGEIRDYQTAELSIRSSLTGHLVFSTLHTKDSLSVITRLKNMGVEPYLISAVLRGSVAQRLVRIICEGCRKKVKPSKNEKELLSRYKLPAGPLFKGEGCKLCRNTGYRGRIGLFEMFMTDNEVEKMIAEGRREAEIRSYLSSNGMKPIIFDGLNKALQGITTISEVERAVSA